MTIYLLRHGQTEWNTQRRFQGHLDSPLTEAGIAQANAMGTTMRDLITDGTGVTLESSPLGRARTTAEIVAAAIGIASCRIRWRRILREVGFGVWQGLTWEEVRARYPGAVEEGEANKWDYQIPEGEPYRVAYQRALEFLSTPCPTQVRIVVTHEIMSRSLRGAYARLRPTEILDLNHRHGCIYRLADGIVQEILTGYCET
jgi:broad specificity phosphatase PhoE